MPDLPPPTPLFEHRPGVWVGESWLPFFGMVLQTRMFVLQLDGGLLLYSPSPAPLDDQTHADLLRLGTPRWMVAPNEIHNVGLKPFQAAFPDIHTTGCPGHPRRVKDVRFDVLLDTDSPQDAVPWTASGEVRFHVIGGNAFLHEIAMLHVPTRTLLVADAIENLDERHVAKPPSAWMRLLMQWMGLREGEPCNSPEHYMYVVDPDALEASMRVLEGWEPESVLLCHGEFLEGAAGRKGLHEAFTRTIVAARRRWRLTRCLWATMSKVQ